MEINCCIFDTLYQFSFTSSIFSFLFANVVATYSNLLVLMFALFGSVWNTVSLWENLVDQKLWKH